MLAHLHLTADGRRLKAIGTEDARVVVEGKAIPVSPEGLDVLLHDRDARERFAACTQNFGEFAEVWRFRDLEGGGVKMLGEDMWEAQAEFARVAKSHPWAFFLKARKLGLSTMSIAYAGWRSRFSPIESNRVHLFSRRDQAAVELLAAVLFGLDGLPEEMRLPRDENRHQITVRAGGHDVRVIESYPTSKDTAREATCQHALVDELAAMFAPASVWQAVEPSIAPGTGSVHVLSTGGGPLNYSSVLWHRAKAGTSRLHPCFIPATARPGRSLAWLEGKRKELDSTAFSWEYPMRPEDALAGSGPTMFLGADLDACIRYARGLGPAKPGHRYVTAWDVGTVDATVGIVLDVTEQVFDVVGFVYLRPATYPTIQRAMERLHREYPGKTVIEDNAAGAAVRANLNIPVHELVGYSTTGPSKARAISQLALAIEGHAITWSPQDCPELDAELRTYRADDKNLHQDTCMALAIAIDSVAHAGGGGPGARVWQVTM